MHSSRKESQGQVGDLKSKTRDELQELLLRQEKILSNRRFLQSLPDGGRKISDFAERLRLAICDRDAEEEKQSRLFSVGTELQSKYQQAFSQRQRVVQPNSGGSSPHRPVEGAAAMSLGQQMDNSHSDHSRVTVEAEEPPGKGLDATATALIQALENVTLSDTSSTRDSTEALCSNADRDNVFLRKHPTTKPPYLQLLERTEMIPVDVKQKFKPNHLYPRVEHDSSSDSMSTDTSLKRSSPLSAQARKEMDRKHLDDITAARQAPLHHSPAQLLSLEESASLLGEQARKHQELQSRIASQKLSEALKVSMGSFVPDSGPMAAYREVHDDGAQLSSEED